MSSRHFLAGYYLRVKPPSTADKQVIDDLSAFAAASTKPVPLEHDKRVFQLLSCVKKNGGCEVVVGTGHYGIISTIFNHKTGTERLRRTVADAESMRLCFVLKMKSSAAGHIAVFSKRGNMGTRTSFQDTFNAFLNTRQAGYTIALNPIGPSKAIEAWMNRGRLASIKLTKMEAADTSIGQLRVLAAKMQHDSGAKKKWTPPSPIVEKSMTIEVKWGHMEVSEKLRRLIGAASVDAAGIAELVGEKRFGATGIEIAIDADRRRRTFRVGSQFRVTEDITSRVEGAAHDIQALEREVFAAAWDYLGVLAKQA